MVLIFFGCNKNTETHDRETVQRQQSQYAKVQPVPFFDWSLERETAIHLYKLRNEKIRTWTVWRSMTGMIEGHCESIGYPIPYDVQLTNPLQPAWTSGTGNASSAVIEQAEPNGLFSSKNTSATWVRSIHRSKDGKVREVHLYVETKVTCYPYPIKVDYATNRVTPADTNDEPTAVINSDKK